MKYNIKSIETKYAGRVFRSRHEANWAAYFDLLRWEWEYEPFDLDGWLPDFQIKGNIHSKKDILVEVKPYEPKEEPEEFQKKIDSISKSLGNGTPFLFLGLKPQYYYGQTRIGTIIKGGEFGAYDVQSAILKSFISEDESVNRKFLHYDLTGEDEMDYFFINQKLDPHLVRGVDYKESDEKWGHAKNKVKFMVRNGS